MAELQERTRTPAERRHDRRRHRLGRWLIHSRGNREAWQEGEASVQQGSPGSQILCLHEERLPQIQIHPDDSRRPIHRPFDHFAKGDNHRIQSEQLQGLPDALEQYH